MKLHIWDTGGSEKFKSVAPLYYKGAHAALVCYSIIDDNSFKGLDEWLKQLEEHGNMKNMIKIIIGNKCDVDKNERRIEIRQGSMFAEQRGFQYFETSAVSNNNSINEVFVKLAAMIKK